jgi:hypothetical protein
MTLLMGGFAVILGSLWFGSLTGDCTQAAAPLLLFWGFYRLLTAEGGQG